MLLLFCAARALAIDTYDPSTGRLTTTTVNIGGQSYFDMTMTIGSVLSVAGGPPGGVGDTYNPVNNQLTVPAVALGNTVYYNVTATVASLDQLIYSPTYYYDGTNVHLPFVKAGGRFYYDVVAAVGDVLSYSFQMPASAWPEYAPSTNQLTIPTVYVPANWYAFGKAFVTNVVVTVAGVVSVGGVAVNVPSAVAASQADATNALVAAGLTVGTVGTQPSSSVAAGTVISQNPTAGTLVAGGSAVNLVISSGPGAAEAILYSFVQPGRGMSCYFPVSVYPSPPILASDGNLYGTTDLGGATNEGTFYQATTGGAQTVLHSFTGNNAASGCALGTTSDGSYPSGAFLQGRDGNFYVAAGYESDRSSVGAVFRFAASGAQSVFYTLGPPLNADTIFASDLIQGSDGNFYGVSAAGGSSNSGALFRITPAGVATVIYWFRGYAVSTDGYAPYTVIQGKDGNFYGTTTCGGINDLVGDCSSGGIFFRITPGGAETVLHDFGGGTDGIEPTGKLIQASDGNFYGVTTTGGSANGGIVYRMTPAGAETVLHAFGADSRVDGIGPTGLIQGSDGNLYGTTTGGGVYGWGTVFRMSLAGATTVLYSFSGFDGLPGFADGAGPTGLVAASDGSLYGTTMYGGAYNVGAIFALPQVVPAP
jgi:uncharacterized repeat protein (TIGR03803 family)